MSLFSIYCGLIYNEFFSVPYHIFGGSAYKCRDDTCRSVFDLSLVFPFRTFGTESILSQLAISKHFPIILHEAK